MPVTIPLEIFQRIFDYFSIREYNQPRLMPPTNLLVANLTPSLPSEARATLDTLSLTCKLFNEFARAISLRDSCISSFRDFTQLCGMTKHCRVFPIETLDITLPESSKKSIQNITSTEFLTIMKQCVRLRSLRMSPPLLTSSRLPRALKSLAQCATLANLRSLQLFPQDHPNDLRRPDPSDLAQVLLLMPNLKVLQIYVPEPFRYHTPYDIHDPSELPPPPFRLEYLVISDDYLNLEWLTSTSHDHLRVAHFANDVNDPLLHLEHPWPKLLYLNLLSFLHSDTLMKTLHCCPNLAFLTLERGPPMNENEEQRLVNFFDALQRPLIGLTLAFAHHPPFLVRRETQFTILATAIESHPILSELRTFTIEVREDVHHTEYENRTLNLRHACEAKGIRFIVVCENPCEDCGIPGYVVPLPDEL